jgi:hypothetical protein
MNAIVAGVLTTLFPVKTIYKILIRLLEFAAARTETTVDDDIVKLVKENLDV